MWLERVDSKSNIADLPSRDPRGTDFGTTQCSLLTEMGAIQVGRWRRSRVRISQARCRGRSEPESHVHIRKRRQVPQWHSFGHWAGSYANKIFRGPGIKHLADIIALERLTPEYENVQKTTRRLEAIDGNPGCSCKVDRFALHNLLPRAHIYAGTPILDEMLETSESFEIVPKIGKKVSDLIGHEAKTVEFSDFVKEITTLCGGASVGMASPGYCACYDLIPIKLAVKIWEYRGAHLHRPQERRNSRTRSYR